MKGKVLSPCLFVFGATYKMEENQYMRIERVMPVLPAFNNKPKTVACPKCGYSGYFTVCSLCKTKINYKK